MLIFFPNIIIKASSHNMMDFLLIEVYINRVYIRRRCPVTNYSAWMRVERRICYWNLYSFKKHTLQAGILEKKNVFMAEQINQELEFS
jgi:hypothetical protein